MIFSLFFPPFTPNSLYHTHIFTFDEDILCAARALTLAYPGQFVDMVIGRD